MWENTDHKNSEYGHLSRSVYVVPSAIPEFRPVFSWFFDIRGNLGNVKEKLARKTCFSREKKRLAPRIYQAKFCRAAFL